MKLKLDLFILVAVILVLAASCKSKSATDENLAPNVHKVTAEEVIQTSNYTYVRVSEDDKENWIAITRNEVEKGKTYYYEDGMEMKDFESKELKRTFPSILFVEKFSAQPILAKLNAADSLKGKQAPVQKEGIKVDPVQGGITIAELYANRDSYAGKTVKIRGEVVKYSSAIMNSNWVHIQDGTSANGAFDLTVTTRNETKVGDVVTFEGTVALKKDFGAGYFYEVIVENATMLTNM
jgi:hypothetical protein